LPKAVKEGGAFTHDGYKATAGWTVTNDKMLDIVGIEGMTFVNADHGSTDTPLFTFLFVGKGETILATVSAPVPTAAGPVDEDGLRRHGLLPDRLSGDPPRRHVLSGQEGRRGASPASTGPSPSEDPLTERPSPSPAAAWSKQTLGEGRRGTAGLGGASFVMST